MKVRTKVRVVVELSANPAGDRMRLEKKVLWEKAKELAKVGKQIFCVTMEDYGRNEDDIDLWTTEYEIHTEENNCSHRDSNICNEVIEAFFGDRYGVLSEKPGYLVWEGKNIPHINKLRAIPERIYFRLHGSYVDVPGIGETVGV